MSSMSTVLISTDEGNNILQYLYNKLIHLNISVHELCYVNQNCEYLAKTIQKYVQNYIIFILADQYEFVFESLSKIYNEKLIVSKHLASVYQINTLDSQNVKKISIPNTSKIFQIQNHSNGINPVCVKFKNIFILPNDLNSVKAIFQNLITPLLSIVNNDEIFEKHFVLNCTQNGFRSMLRDSLKTFADSVNITQYCSIKSDSNCLLHINLTSKNFPALVKCENAFKRVVSNDDIMQQSINNSYWDRLELLKNEGYVEEALQIIKCCYSEYLPQDVFLCFNGGKDCTVLLYLTCYVLHTIQTGNKDPLLCLYIQPDHPFEEVEHFIEQCREFYNLEIITIKNTIKAGLEEILKQRPNLAACLMGTRRTDPFASSLNHFAMTDPDWPQVMRINPLLDWKYSQIWSFLLTCKIPYCELYDQGFTSLGSSSNTGPNPSLKYIKNGISSYHPAYKLEKESQERNGRYQNKK